MTKNSDLILLKIGLSSGCWFVGRLRATAKLQYPFVENIEDLDATPFNTKLWPEKKTIWSIKEALFKPKAKDIDREFFVIVEE
jgi:hypothetical protein